MEDCLLARANLVKREAKLASWTLTLLQSVVSAPPTTMAVTVVLQGSKPGG